MKTKSVLGISIAAVFAVSLIFAQNAQAGIPTGDHKEVTGFDVEKFGNTVHVTISTSTISIPDSSETGYAFGYGLVTGTAHGGNPENVLALTTHLCVSDTLVQGPSGSCPDPTAGLLELLGLGSNEAHNDETWHAHILDLKPATQACITAVANDPRQDVHGSTGLEVDVARTLQTQNNLSPSWLVETIDGDIWVTVPRGDVHSDAFKKAGALYFGIVGIVDTSDSTDPVVTNLCLTAPP